MMDSVNDKSILAAEAGIAPPERVWKSANESFLLPSYSRTSRHNRFVRPRVDEIPRGVCSVEWDPFRTT